MMDLVQFKEKYRIHESYGFLPYPAPLEQLQEEPFVSSWELLVKKIPLYVEKEQEKLIEMIDNVSKSCGATLFPVLYRVTFFLLITL